MRFATCPPRLWRSSLTSAKRTGNPLLLRMLVILKLKCKTPFLATGMACLSQRNQGGAPSPGPGAGDIRGDEYAVVFAGK